MTTDPRAAASAPAVVVTFHESRSTLRVVCDICGALVGGDQADRARHQAWHNHTDDELVVDLTTAHTDAGSR